MSDESCKIVVHEVKRDGVFEIFNHLREAVCQARKLNFALRQKDLSVVEIEDLIRQRVTEKAVSR